MATLKLPVRPAGSLFTLLPALLAFALGCGEDSGSSGPCDPVCDCVGDEAGPEAASECKNVCAGEVTGAEDPVSRCLQRLAENGISQCDDTCYAFDMSAVNAGDGDG